MTGDRVEIQLLIIVMFCLVFLFMFVLCLGRDMWTWQSKNPQGFAKNWSTIGQIVLQTCGLIRTMIEERAET